MCLPKTVFQQIGNCIPKNRQTFSSVISALDLSIVLRKTNYLIYISIYDEFFVLTK